MRYEIRSIGIWGLIKVGFFLNLLIGFLFGIFSSLIFIPIARAILAMSGAGDMGADEGSSVGMLLLLPILLAILGAFFNTLFMVLIAACYNLVARVVGGLEFEFNAMPSDSFLKVSPVTSAGPVVDQVSGIAPVSMVAVPPPPPFRPEPVVPTEEPIEVIQSQEFVLPDELPVKISQADQVAPDTSPVIEPHTEPDEDGPRRDNP
ncbi:MAG: DUF3566 domain-containing protein [bacterium]|nr:DUF3566 domain-containing protein [bacterium]